MRVPVRDQVVLGARDHEVGDQAGDGAQERRADPRAPPQVPRDQAERHQVEQRERDLGAGQEVQDQQDGGE